MAMAMVMVMASIDGHESIHHRIYNKTNFAQTFNKIAALILLDKHFATRTLLEVKFSLQK